METNQGSALFLGTKVYVDSRNTNESPDGSVNNPFATLEQAFAYVDSTDESYVVHIINIGKESSFDYIFTKKGNLGIVGDLTYSMQSDAYFGLSLRFQDEEAILCMDGLTANLIVYGGKEVYLNNISSQRIRLYDTKINVRINNCRGLQRASDIILACENGDNGLLNNLDITNSLLTLTVDRKVYYALATNSSIMGIQSSLLEPIESMIQFWLNGCFINYIQRSGALEKSTFSLTSCWLNVGVDADDSYIVMDTDIALPYMNFTNYTPVKNTLLSYLEAIDKKLGEHQARIDSL